MPECFRRIEKDDRLEVTLERAVLNLFNDVSMCKLIFLVLRPQVEVSDCWSYNHHSKPFLPHAEGAYRVLQTFCKSIP